MISPITGPRSRRNSGPLLALAALAGVILCLSCAGGGETRERRARDGAVIVAVDSAPDNLDPRIGTSQASYRTQQLLYNPLVNQGVDGRLVADLAERWERLPSPDGGDGERWIFHLRRGVVFHDGNPFTADDAAYTFQSLIAPEFISRKKAAFSAIAAVRAIDEYTIEFVLSRRQPSFVSNMPAIGIIPAGWQSKNDPPPGTGPFRFAGREGTRLYHFAAHDSYWQGVPGIRTLTLAVVPEETTRALEMMHGSIDLVINDLAVSDAVNIARRPGMSIVHAPGLSYEYLGFNHEHPILANRLVRRAIAHAIDREAIITHLLGGLARPAVSPMVPELWQGPAAFESIEYDPARATVLLDEAGYPDPDGDGPRPRFTLEMKSSTQRNSRDLAVVIRQQLEAVGIDVTVRSTEWQTYYSDIVNGNFSLHALRWIGIIDPEFFGSVFHSASIPGIQPTPDAPQRGSLNRGRYRNGMVDALVDEAEAELDPERRWAVYARLQATLRDDPPYVDLWYRDNYAVMRADLTGMELTLNASFGVLWRLRYVQ